MSVPTHRDDCETRMWPTSCPDCADEVYFFSCSCGSKVFFDLPGPPWPYHADRCIPYLIRYLTTDELIPAHLLLERVRAYAREHDLTIPSDILRQLQEYAGGRRRPGVTRVPPGDEDVWVDGEVVEINRNVNFFRRLNVPDTQMARAMLGELLRHAYCEVVVRERDVDSRQVFQYTFFARQQLVERAGLRVSANAFVVLNPRRLPNNQRVWIAAQIARE